MMNKVEEWPNARHALYERRLVDGVAMTINGRNFRCRRARQQTIGFTLVDESSRIVDNPLSS